MEENYLHTCHLGLFLVQIFLGRSTRSNLQVAIFLVINIRNFLAFSECTSVKIEPCDIYLVLL